MPAIETGMSRPRRAAAEVGVLRDRSRTKPATPCLLEPLTPARMASFSSPVNLFGTPRGRPGPGRSLVNEPLFAFLCLFLRLTGLGTLVTGPGKSRGMFVHYLVPLMGLWGPGILEDIVRRCEFLKPEAGLAKPKHASLTRLPFRRSADAGATLAAGPPASRE